MARDPRARTGGACRRRGVSPINGIILRVAITVGLAATLYVLVSETTTGGDTSAPHGYDLGLGPTQEIAGTKATASYCQNNHPCFETAISSVGGGVTLGSVNFMV